MDKGIDLLGNIAILKFDREKKNVEKKKYAWEFLKRYKNVSTVLEKTDKFSGRLRTQSAKFLAGINTKEALYRENGCVFRLNVETCYFSPRLSEERKDVAKLIKKGEEVLVMFGGVGPFAIVIGKNSKAKRIVSVELGKDCSKYASVNVKRNKLENVEIVQGDVRRRVPGLGTFDRIVMARPNLEDSFLDVAFKAIRKNGTIHYYGFYLESEKDKLKELIFDEAKKAGKRIKFLGMKKAGDIGVGKYRYRADFKVLN